MGFLHRRPKGPPIQKGLKARQKVPRLGPVFFKKRVNSILVQNVRITRAVAEAILAYVLDAYQPEEDPTSTRWKAACTHSAMAENILLASG